MVILTLSVYRRFVASRQRRCPSESRNSTNPCQADPIRSIGARIFGSFAQGTSNSTCTNHSIENSLPLAVTGISSAVSAGIKNFFEYSPWIVPGMSMSIALPL